MSGPCQPSSEFPLVQPVLEGLLAIDKDNRDLLFEPFINTDIARDIDLLQFKVDGGTVLNPIDQLFGLFAEVAAFFGEDPDLDVSPRYS